VSKPLVITDRGIKEAGLLDILLKALRSFSIEPCVIYDSVPSDSSTETVAEIAELFKSNNCDCFIALGGGSVIDTAKGTNILVSTGVKNLSEIMGVDRISHILKPLIVIPTTSGTGSEATLVAVISDKASGYKLPFVSYQLVPTLAILDPRFTVSLPRKLTAATGIDALVHAIEAYTCLQKNPISDSLAWKSIEIIAKYLPVVLDSPGDNFARLAMANASLMAGMAFSNSMVGAVHAIGHALGAVAHVHHGTAMAILLPWVMEANLSKVGQFYAELLLPMAGEHVYFKTDEQDRAKVFVQVIREFLQQIHDKSGLPLRLRDVRVEKQVFEQVAQKAINDGSMSTNPVDFSAEQVIEILQKSY
jgi:alcohol dehydrogenase